MGNNYPSGLWVYPEDNANRDIALGFLLIVPPERHRKIDIKPILNGWGRKAPKDIKKIIEEDDLERKLTRNQAFFVLFLLDLDDDLNRLSALQTFIKSEYPTFFERIFFLGAKPKPEALSSNAKLGGKEEVGAKLAEECRDNTHVLWKDETLQHNSGELIRLSQNVKALFFS